MPLGKLWVAAAPPKHSLNQKCGRDSERAGVKEGGRERGLELGSAPEREERGRGGAQERRRRSREFITVNISRGRQEGWGWGPRRLLSPAASDPGSSEVGAASRPTRDRRTTESEPRAASHAGLRAVGTGASEAHPPGSPHVPRGPPSPRSPGTTRPLCIAFHARPLSFGTGWLSRGGEGEAEEQKGRGPRRPEPGESGMPEPWRRRWRRTGEDDAAAP